MYTATYLKKVGSVEQSMVTEIATVAKRLGNKVRVSFCDGWMVVSGLLSCNHTAEDVLTGDYGFSKVCDYE